MNIIITYRNKQSSIFEEKNLDCSKLTIKGHASSLIQEWKKLAGGIYEIDDYNAILLDEVIEVRVI